MPATIKYPKQFAEAQTSAALTVHITVNEARTMPGFMGRIIPVNLIQFGWYAARVDGIRILFIHRFE